MLRIAGIFSSSCGHLIRRDLVLGALKGSVVVPERSWLSFCSASFFTDHGNIQTGSSTWRINGGWAESRIDRLSLNNDRPQKRGYFRHNAKMRQRGRPNSRRSVRPEGKSPGDLADEDEEEYFEPKIPYKTVSGDAIKASFDDFPSKDAQKLLQVGLLGVPNAGKSELTNRLVGNKVTATSSKENTTVATGVGVFVVGNTQVVLYDLPGVLHPDDAKYVGQLARVKGAWATAAQCDYILFLVDSSKHLKLMDRNEPNRRLDKIFAKLKIGLDENGQVRGKGDGLHDL